MNTNRFAELGSMEERHIKKVSEIEMGVKLIDNENWSLT